MGDCVIRAEGVGKLYRLGEFGTGTISHDLNRWWAKMRGKVDPFSRVGEENDRTSGVKSDWVWALRDIDFEVKSGEVLGIIGRNGAGKSTLLKILSKVTTPTQGQIKVKGRIASLLEVGTGFHPELTGRENVFLNGAILGMTRREVRSKFEEIVEFAGVQKYIDTPVKRYSSGMYVRLAFAVAAFLEPEILIVDEVLAVGDAEFQKKCLGRMNEVSQNEGRTVLFVSHRMDAISRLCKRSIVLNNGSLLFDGEVGQAIQLYFGKNADSNASYQWSGRRPGNEVVKLNRVSLSDEEGIVREVYDIRKPVQVKMEYEILQDNAVVTHGLNLYNYEGVHILSSHDVVTGREKKAFSKGIYEAVATIPGNFLAEGNVSVAVAMMSYDPFIVHFHETDVLTFSVVDSIEGDSARGIYGGDFPGVVRPILNWDKRKLWS